MKNIKYIITLSIGIFSLFSCNDLNQLPYDKFTDETYWESVDNSELMVNMAYNKMYSAERMWRDEALSDNMYEGRGNSDERLIRNGIADPSLSRFADEWKEHYKGIKFCHMYLQNIDRVPEMDIKLKEKRKAEVRFLRAYMYFRLTNLYGDVPFFTQDITIDESKAIKRTSRATIIKFIHDELDEIVNALPNRDEFEKNDVTKKDRGRITKGAAIALQARVYLYDNDFAKVKEYCDKLINKQSEYGTYSLFVNGYAGIFLPENEYNEEVILDYAYVSPTTKQWSTMYDMAPISQGARLNQYAPTQSLVDDYLMISGKTIKDDATYSEDNPYINRDPRLAATIVHHNSEWTKTDGSIVTIKIKPGSGGSDEYKGSGQNQSPTGYYTRKYYDPQSDKDFRSGLNIIMFRYADILLMYAEAELELGSFNQSVWDMTIKPIRKRAGFTQNEALNYPASATPAQMKEILRRERRCEMALEGLRFFDIKRWKEGTKYLNGVVLGAKYGPNNTYIRLDNRRFDENKDYLWSVPRQEMNQNGNLKPNNPGYAN